MVKFFISVPIIAILFFMAFGSLLGVNDLKEICDKSANNCQNVADAIVVVSGGNTSLRTKHGIDLYKKGLAKKIIFSGAAAYRMPPSNAKQMKEQALKSGIKADDILMDEFSTNTHENAQFSSDIIRKNNFQKIILVTSGYHQLRTNFEFKKALKGNYFQIINSPVEDDPDWIGIWWLKPRGWYLVISEFAGIVKFLLWS